MREGIRATEESLPESLVALFSNSKGDSSVSPKTRQTWLSTWGLG
ncbi:hypothetical protein [Helicobacter marmotae]|nr:hypothetical protein [Helicobacter marmotae]